jgi:carbonic anhydrase
VDRPLAWPQPQDEVPAEAALRRLREGNQRFANELTSMRSRITATREWRAHVADRQTPFAAVVACSDSRVPAEIIFDQGLGDLFIVRNAGAVIGHAPLASLEFALEQLKVHLIVVLAHERCGAFRATFDHHAGGALASTESLRELVQRLTPALEAAGPDGTRDERCDRAAAMRT